MASNTLFRRTGVLLAGGGVYGMAVYGAYHYTHLLQDSRQLDDDSNLKDAGVSHVTNPQRTQQFQKIASKYDSEIGRDEFFMGMNVLRRLLLFWHAQGTCLEVAAGTARNLPYYRLNSNVVHRVVLSDASDQMLAQAKQKIQKTLPPSKQARFALLHRDAAHLDLPDQAFDTVIDTFGLCSFEDPQQVLRELARVCKPTGKILLLEHGRSPTWDFVTRHLDRHAQQHAAHWGCVWNRDLDALLQEVQDSLQVQVLSRYHFGTTYYVVCKPIQQEK